MFSRRSLLALTLASSSVFAQQPAAKAPALTLKVVTDRADAIYHAGDTATFQIESSDASLTTVSANVSEDGWKPQPAQNVSLTQGKGTLSVKLTKPGFTLVRITAPKTTVSAMASAACDPAEIKPSLPVPDDFDSFWSAQKAALAKVPVKFALTQVATQAKTADAFDAQIDCLGAPVSGYYGRPKDAKAKSHPAILFVHGAGVGGSNLGSTYWAEKEGGMLALDINAHGLPNGKPAEFYKEQEKGALKDYRYVGRSDRETNYFKGMFLRLVRAIDFLTAQPEWDGKTVIVYGSSQGGFQAFAAGALDERVTYICAGVPAGCDHTGISVDRINGWPKLVTITDGKPNEAELQTARYFDNVNFAQRCHAKGAAVTVGFIDTVCPPTSVYAAYNALTVPKQIHIDTLSGHTSTPGASKFMQEAAFAHVREMKAGR
ncbi:acetylxylan esterase [Brevifollis gellanilyticus]|uniref:Cephalosporin deacetylase n=1 Tax=Brevifollis gellanilyticus TaxID=748831 RepID=A0A512M6H1_9BACT|nr:acetylxylan esterase [Brevifollis gellanilyticus]GEP42332.1 cephalosporin deacetylase [Brevifollis gellanilyticus]